MYIYYKIIILFNKNLYRSKLPTPVDQEKAREFL